MNANLVLFLGFLGALLASLATWRTGNPAGTALAAIGSALIGFAALVFLLALLGAVVLA